MEQNTTLAVLTPEALHARYARKIRNHIWAILGPDDEHEDIVQDVFVTILRRIDSLRDPACIDGWVARITTNTLKYLLRRRRFRRHASLEALPESQLPSCQPNFQARELASRAIEVMHQLPAKELTLLSTYWFTPATANTIAATTGSSIVTVRRRLFKARSRFQKLARREPALSACTVVVRRGQRSGGIPTEV